MKYYAIAAGIGLYVIIQFIEYVTRYGWPS